ncbi:acyl-CoA carboxylase subunit beta [Billgrantia endophytica]|uniref:Propionyl-CoA carboxylase n=1 Tax=Billgrantia endophytica TaxID=2033802 RepID=A0A2N7TVV7_9GAMM|nr:carboxyl transferase domain-containing protein [Halomonas endophytica]PMR72295.1 propionyl-CoA carboxylase [Halomonas endophytica]
MRNRVTSEPTGEKKKFSYAVEQGWPEIEGGIEELKFRRQQAQAMGGGEAIERQHKAGRLTVRERITLLTDANSFREIGTLAGSGKYDENNRLISVTPAPYIAGMAHVDGRPVAVGGEDFTVRGGTTFGSLRRKGGQGGFVEDLAYHYRIPLLNLIDGAGGSVTSIQRRGHSVFPGVHGFERSVSLLGTVPVASAVLGTAAGGPAGRAILSHFSVMVRETSQIFAAGPPVVKRSLGRIVDKEMLGGARVAVDQAGTIHNAAESEEDALRQMRRFLSFMPSNVWEMPPVAPTDDPVNRCDEELASIIPAKRTQAYNMYRLIEMVIDKGSEFEIQPTHAKAVITLFARLDGRPVGIVANNPMVYSGALDDKAARKQIHFMELCDTFHIPLIFLVDLPGFMVGEKAEQSGTLREGMRAVYSAGNLKVPTLTLVIRKCYGMAGMATCNKNDIDLKLAWPSAEWGSLPVEGGVAAAFRRDIMSAPDPAAREKEIEAELKPYASPFRSAEAFAVEEIIDPRETRPVLCDFINLADARLRTELGPRARYGVQP